MSRPIVSNMTLVGEDEYKRNAAAYERFAGLDGPSEEEEAAAIDEIERQIDEEIERQGGAI